MDIAALEQIARQELAPETFALIASWAGEGLAARRNEEAFRERSVVARVLRDVTTVDVATELLSTSVSAPIGVAPLPRLGSVHADGECAVALAAAEAGVLFCAATNSSIELEALSVPGAPAWFQLYPHSDAAVTSDLAQRAGAAGYAAVVVTADRPVPGAKATEAAKSTRPEDLPNLARYGSDAVVRRHNPAFTWPELADLVAASPLPVVLKGVLSAADARSAVERGCAGVWVSNHGGRQLDQAACPLDVLEEIGRVVDGRAQVYLDGGVRRGLDVLIALALGADAVFVGRPVAYALAAGGQAGVAALLREMAAELRQTMALAGVGDLGMIERGLIR